MAHSGIAALVAAFAAGLVACQVGTAFVAAPLGRPGLDGHMEPAPVSAAPGAAPASAPVGVGLTMIGASVAVALLARGALSSAGREARAKGPAQHRVVMALAAEIANGRLAMMAIIGMFFQDGLTGSAWGDWALYTGSPLRAFESELGVQDPVGFWDPAGFTADGSTENFARRRQTELKHGRVSMLATMGYITPEITGKLPGYLSPSAGLKFAGHPEWARGDLQGSRGGLGADRGVRRVLRAVPGPVRWHRCRRRRLRLQGADVQ
ncbi:unnamed protein product [Prorocentrum cordatum]|uniref:Uncharacterized protein n=1 Tax=Prorocentrum cordatum TaxID=2364126 RepID=A0ABN9UJ25_9DINO|nr:unnamed protein product [Polarella glacialis]